MVIQFPIICKTCRNIFHVKRWRLKKNPKYCSYDCYHKDYRGKQVSPKTQFKKGYIPWNKGKPSPKRTLEKMSRSRLKLYKMHPGLCKKISECTKKTMKNVPYEMLAYWLGKKRPESAILRGKNSPHWKGGISEDGYGVGWTKNLRDKVGERDNCICQECGIAEHELTGWMSKHDIHHIDRDKNNNKTENLITLCRRCHIKLHRND